jgi:hypothetical protein
VPLLTPRLVRRRVATLTAVGPEITEEDGWASGVSPSSKASRPRARQGAQVTFFPDEERRPSLGW